MRGARYVILVLVTVSVENGAPEPNQIEARKPIDKVIVLTHHEIKWHGIVNS
jgi:hypothetical protein